MLRFIPDATSELTAKITLGLRTGDGLHGHHVNGDILDNRRTNLEALRPDEHSARHGHLHQPSQRFEGVYWRWRRGRRQWVASLSFRRGHRVHLGTFPSEVKAADAVRSYLAAIHA